VFGELPKIFGKEFLVGYFLPAAIFLVAASLVTDISNSLPISSFLKTTLAAADEKKVALYLGSVAVVTWGVATLFLVVNFTLIRALEGYGWLNPARLPCPVSQRWALFWCLTPAQAPYAFWERRLSAEHYWHYSLLGRLVVLPRSGVNW
jgi:hypothetical protein